MTDDLFADLPDPRPPFAPLAEGAVALPGFALGNAEALWCAVQQITAIAPLQKMQTPGGRPMSVVTSSCGQVGWVSDSRGYRYAPRDPRTGQPWPAMPPAFSDLARIAAGKAGFADFVPDSCLINCYVPGAQMSLHQDRDERDFGAPIVSVSLGLPIVFLFGGMQRSDRPLRYRLLHGDVVVWGGPARLAFHGVAKLEDGQHPLLGRQRINLTFRKAV